MPWKKGQSGNPLGRLPGEKQFADQLRIVLAEPVDKNDPKSVRKMRRIAEKLVECALDGEPWAIAQVADRIDGKTAVVEFESEHTHRYVIEIPAVQTTAEWEAEALPTTSGSPPAPKALDQAKSLILLDQTVQQVADCCTVGEKGNTGDGGGGHF